MKRFAVFLPLLIGLAACGSTKSAAPATTAEPMASAAPTTTLLAATTTLAPTTTAAAATTLAPTTAPATTAPASLMPDVVCMNLQAAQDLIQTTGVFLSLSEDATGRGRMQVLDRNWQVVRQTPSPGTPIGEGDAILYVVKYGESPNPC